MGNTNSTNDKIRDFFNDDKWKKVGYTIGDGLGKLTNYASAMMNNMMKMSTNMSNFMGTSYFPYILLGCGGIFVAWKLKMI